jgi:hypothetical protein
MNWEVRSCLALSAVIASSLTAAEPGSGITVLVYNYASVAPEVLAQTEAEAARIFQGEVNILWLDCPLTLKDADQVPACQGPLGPTILMVRILPQSAAGRLRPERDSFGFAMFSEDGSFGVVANVFPHDAEQLAQRRGLRPAVILGHVLAHETGHLLLGADSHSVSGIMHVPWRVKDLEIMAEGRMLFTPGEARRMRMNVQERIQAAQ